jgi:hypothetical protein
MPTSRPQPQQSLRTPRPQLLHLGVALHGLLQGPQALQATAGGGQEEKVVDGLNQRLGNNSILRAERHTQVQCASLNLDARPKDEGTIFRGDRGLISTCI